MTRIAVCMIVRDGAATIARAIESVRAHVAEVNVYDTGSTDGTLELLAELAAAPGARIRVARGDWPDDFAAARNRSFDLASPDHDWITWLDADDVVEGAVHFDALVRLSRGAPVICASYISAVDGEVYTARPRLIRRDSCPYWRGIVHEELRWGDNSIDVAMVHPNVTCWTHWRHDKWPSYSRNLEILERDLARAEALGVEPEEMTLFNLGCTLSGTDPRRAMGYFRLYLERTSGRYLAGRVLALDLLEEMCPGMGFGRWAAGERAGYPEMVAAGRVVGLTKSSPVFWDYVVATFAKNVRLRLGRNDPCWCGSGRKLKVCCELGELHWPAIVSTVGPASPEALVAGVRSEVTGV